MNISKSLIITLIILFYNYTYAGFEQNNENIEFKKIYVLKHRWHTGIIINRSEARELLPTLGNDFNNSEYIEIGWGDKDFYMSEKGSLLLALRAVLWPTESVLHVAEINSHPLWLFKEQEIIEFELTNEDFAKLIQYFNESFFIDSNQNNYKLGKGLYSNSQFYLSNEKYHLFKTCNVWTVKALKKAGLPVHPAFAFTSKNVMKQISKKQS